MSQDNKTAKQQRKLLNIYAAEIKNIELTEAAIVMLERVMGMGHIVNLLKKKQHSQLSRIDRAAEKLGAPYGS